MENILYYEYYKISNIKHTCYQKSNNETARCGEHPLLKRFVRGRGKKKPNSSVHFNTYINMHQKNHLWNGNDARHGHVVG